MLTYSYASYVFHPSSRKAYFYIRRRKAAHHHSATAQRWSPSPVRSPFDENYRRSSPIKSPSTCYLLVLLHLDFERYAFAHYSFFLFLCSNKNTNYTEIQKNVLNAEFSRENCIWKDLIQIFQDRLNFSHMKDSFL